MGFLYALSEIRFPLLDEIMLLVTRLGEETVFLVTALILFWCVDKKKGYYVLCVGFAGTLANHFLKLLCRIPRPWVSDPSFPAVEGAKAAANGYSFPSGHTQTAVGTFGAIARCNQRKWLRVLCAAVCVLVPFSRMYLGVHTPADVLVASVMAVALIFGFYKVVYEGKERNLLILMAVLAVLSAAFLAYVEFFPFPETVTSENYESALKNAYTLLFCMLGLLTVYAVDVKLLRFSVDAVWWAQILKVILGGALVFAVKSGLKAPLEALFDGHMIARGIRYYLIVTVAGVLWPVTFRWFAALGSKSPGK